MSTKRIREALEAMGRVLGRDMVAGALEDLEGIERAADVLSRADIQPLGFLTVEEIEEAEAFIESIAKDAP